MSESPPVTVGAQLARAGISRRSLLDFCGKLMVAAPFGLALTESGIPSAVAAELEGAHRLSVIWLHFQDCTGCTETLLRTSEPDLADLVLQLISLDYHETLMAASGHAAEKALHEAMAVERGKYVLVVEGSIPQAENGVYMKIAGKTALDTLAEVAADAAAVIAIGSCASWGGIPSAPPNPTQATGVDTLVKDKPVINLPGCPPNPYVLLATVLQYAVGGTLPALDDQGRPLFAYDRTIHDHCPRRSHFDAGEFATSFGDEGHRKGWCLYELGWKGPETHAPCSTRHFNEMPGVWPIGIGAPCFGCTEKDLAFKRPFFDHAALHTVAPPSTYPGPNSPSGELDPVATGLVGATLGAVAGATYVASQRFSNDPVEKAGGDEGGEA